MAKTTCNHRQSYGALHCAAGTRAGVTMTPPSRYAVTRTDNGNTFPFWTGECGSVEPVRAGCYESCPRCGPEACECNRCFRAHGAFSASAPVSIAAGGSVIFTASCDTPGLTLMNGSIRIENSGTYYASYTMNVPENVSLETTLTLNLSDRTVASTDVMTSGGAASVFSGQAVFSAESGDILSLSSTDAINIPNGTIASPVFTLFLFRISD